PRSCDGCQRGAVRRSRRRDSLLAGITSESQWGSLMTTTPTGSWQASHNGDATPGRMILILEDNETLAFGLRTSLEVEGYNVDCVTDGNEGLDWLAQHTPDLIVLDLMLPGLNGFEVLRRYRANGGNAAVLILSARDQEVDKVQGFRIGADDYVVKPVGVLEFLARVEAIMRRLSPRPQVHT